MKKRILTLAPAALASMALCASAQMSQTLPSGFDNVQGTSGTSFPQNTTSDHKWQWHYDNVNFTQTGPITITEVYVRALNPGDTVNAFDFTNFTVTLSEATTDYQVGAHDPIFANNLGAGSLTQVVRTGQWSSPSIPPSGGATSTWIPFGLTTPFVYDPTSGEDFIVQIEKCGTVATWGVSMDGTPFPAAPGTNRGNRYGDTSNCASLQSSFSNNEFVPIVRIDYMGGGGTTVYCTAKVNSLGCTPAISGSGSPSASMTSGYTIDCAMVRNNKSGLLFYAVNGMQANVTFQCGTLCVGPSGIKRTPAQSAGGNPPPANDCSGLYSLDMNAFAAGMAGGNPDPALQVAGTQVNCQWWGRDQGFPAPCNTTLSDGAEYMIQP